MTIEEFVRVSATNNHTLVLLRETDDTEAIIWDAPGMDERTISAAIEFRDRIRNAIIQFIGVPLS